MVLGVQMPSPALILCRTIDWSGVVAIMDTVACGGVRLPEIRRPSRDGGLGLRGEGDVRCLMLHSRFVEGLEPCGVLMIWLGAVKVMRTVKAASGAKLQVAREDWWQVRHEVTTR